jgi:multiple sugar transport system permease protein
VHNWDVCLFHFFFAWNDFLGPLVYLIGREDLWPISVGMSYFTGQFVTLPQLIQATAMMALALPVGLFLIAQRFFVQGVVVTGIDKWLKRDRIDLRAFSRILRVF